MKYFLSLILFSIPNALLACPGCAGSMDNPKDKYTVLILAIFIFLAYIPLMMIYKIIFKGRKINPSFKDKNDC